MIKYPCKYAIKSRKKSVNYKRFCTKWNKRIYDIGVCKDCTYRDISVGDENLKDKICRGMVEDGEMNRVIDEVIEDVRMGGYSKYGDYTVMDDVDLRIEIIKIYDRIKEME